MAAGTLPTNMLSAPLRQRPLLRPAPLAPQAPLHVQTLLWRGEQTEHRSSQLLQVDLELPQQLPVPLPPPAAPPLALHPLSLL